MLAGKLKKTKFIEIKQIGLIKTKKNSKFSPNHQLLSFQRQSELLTRSSSVHDLHRHEVFRANELDFGPIIGQGFYGIARTVSSSKKKIK